ncbi:MAG: aminotransferase class V-fold PLP-dependent enzyme [Pseudomonadota bacterium]
MPPPEFPTSFEEAAQFDRDDRLRDARDAFAIDEGITYLVGHSLGPPTQYVLNAARQTAEQDWASGLVGSWNSADWIDLPSIVGAKIAPLIGVGADDVIVCDSVSINLFKLVRALLQSCEYRNRIIVQADEFPTDQYILEQLAQMTGAEFIRADQGDVVTLLAEGGIFVRSLVDYRTAEIAPVETYERAARESGAAIVWDLSHATGVVDLKLAQWGAKFAVGCTYKYLNGGPGAPAFLYVDPDHIGSLQTPLAGWLGHAQPFAFEPHYTPADGVQRFVAGTPPILSMAALNAALDTFDSLTLPAISEKSLRLGDMCLNVFERLGLESISPGIGQARGGHVSLSHSSGYEISRALADRGHKTDFRPPSTIRFGLSPLFLSYAEVWKTLEALEDILKTEAYSDPKYSVRNKVT